jgi:hypothetical protein
MDTITLMVVIVAALAVFGAVVWYMNRQRSLHLRDKFGPEYERTRAEAKDVRQAEATLAAREKRVEQFHIRPLTADETTRFAEVWRHVQTLFVDDPKGAVGEADHLVNEVMTARGYPVADFHQRAADISVDHPVVVEHYRAAKAIADRNKTGSASTEDLRNAVIHYRALFEDLLQQKRSEGKPVHARR